jgi:hypothetical protein
MPTATSYKGVAIHAGQPAKRVRLVKSELDKVTEISDLVRLFEISGDCAWSPEARLCSAVRCLAGLELATERRQGHPGFDRGDIEARKAGLASLTWAHPDKYCTLLDPDHERAAPREQPLEE